MISSKYHTKTWRLQQSWYINGKHNECERFQMDTINNYLKKNGLPQLQKTNDRINTFTCDIVSELHPYTNNYGYDITENFDGKIVIDNTNMYFNFKFVCNAGGSQTRTLKNVYEFILNQCKINMTNNVFINILDGDEAYKNRNKYEYLIDVRLKKDHLKYRLFVGDSKEFVIWFNKIMILKHLKNYKKQ